MTMPTGIGIADCMVGFPDPDPRRLHDFFTTHIKDSTGAESMVPVDYLFKDNVPGRAGA